MKRTICTAATALVLLAGTPVAAEAATAKTVSLASVKDQVQDVELYTGNSDVPTKTHVAHPVDIAGAKVAYQSGNLKVTVLYVNGRPRGNQLIGFEDSKGKAYVLTPSALFPVVNDDLGHPTSCRLHRSLGSVSLTISFSASCLRTTRNLEVNVAAVADVGDREYADTIDPFKIVLPAR